MAALYGRLGVPVVPVALNSGCFWPRRAFLKRPGKIIVEILPAIAPGLAKPAFMATLEERIETATARLEAEAAAAASRGIDLWITTIAPIRDNPVKTGDKLFISF